MKIRIGAALALMAALTACGLQYQSIGDLFAPTPLPSPSPSVLPTPVPPTSTPAAVSDVDHMGLFFYGDTCTAGKVQNDGVIPSTCTEALVTATPKQAEPCTTVNCDAVNHGRALTWRAGGQVSTDGAAVDAGCATVSPGPKEITFNRTIHVKFDRSTPPKRLTCSFLLEASLADPAGRTHYTSQTVEVQ